MVRPSSTAPDIQSLSLSASSSGSTSNSSSTLSTNSAKERKYSSLVSTLRGHNSGISTIETFHIPSNLSYHNDNDPKDTQLLIPSLLTADENGWIIWWDLNTRRPIGCFQAHSESPILSLKQLGISWEKSSSGDFLIPSIDPELYGCILTHGKDGEIKVWRLIDLIEIENTQLYLYRNSTVLQKKFPPPAFDRDSNSNSSLRERETWRLPPLIFQMPVNMLNFSNVDINSRGLLITPSTQQSEMFDVYQIDLSGKKLEQARDDEQQQQQQQDDLFQFDGKLKRLFKAIDSMKLIESQNLDFHIQHIQDYESGKSRNDFGIVMKIQWIDSSSFVIGYESGHILTYRLSENNIKIVSFNSIHFPNPILSLKYDPIDNRVFSTSANDKLVIDNLKYLGSNGSIDVTTNDEYIAVHKIRHKGIADITLYHHGSKVDDIIGLITWDGYSRFYTLSKDNRDLSLLFKLKKSSPAISMDKLNDKQTIELESKFNGNSDISGEEGNTRVRANCIAFSTLQKSYPLLKRENSLNFINGISKMIIRRRDEEMFDKQWVFVGFKDGKVALYNLMI